jgi:type II secretory pathway component PulJ
VTLVEMLVTMMLLVLMMVVIVKIFQAATGAVSVAKTYQELDQSLRQLDTTLRRDLNNITATLTPPLNPNDNKGYFEYDENEFADLQGEDTDDILRFTVKAPAGQPFTGRAWVGPLLNPFTGVAPPSQPIMVTSQYAEVIYFLRNGNLYRRVLLIAPERQASLSRNPITNLQNTNFNPVAFNGQAVSWQGMNDLSARPAGTGTGSTGAIILNTLGDLTNRENRFGYSRFASDYVQHSAPWTPIPDGLPDDENPDNSLNFIGDGVPDYYPTLYPYVFGNSSPTSPRRVWEAPGPIPPTACRKVSPDTMAFPYVFPGAYSQPDPNSATNGYGWIHSLNPVLPTAYPSYLAFLQSINHAPLDTGDTLPPPGAPAPKAETWWGLPTWRETLSVNWNDPWKQLYTANVNSVQPSQPNGLSLVDPSMGASAFGPLNLLPPMTNQYRLLAQPNTDGAGTPFYALNFNVPGSVWNTSWEDDLIMTGVRSFDVKAYDNAYSGYVDLGWGDDLRLYVPYGAANTPATPPFLAGTPTPWSWPPNPGPGSPKYDVINQTFAHEGRMPPLYNDARLDPQFPNGFLNSAAWGYDPNIGDDQHYVIRLRRVWDTWSTAYTRAPANGHDPTTAMPVGPPFSPPIYTSYPPPYPAPLRGIQIQIRVVDPRQERLKVLTIRQDFSDKL